MIVATGPLTSDTLSQAIQQFVGDEHLAFYDAISPIVLAESIGSTGFPLVAPTQPQSSALVQELLRDAGDEPLWQAQHPMPPDSPLGFADLVLLSHWIADGAPLE